MRNPSIAQTATKKAPSEQPLPVGKHQIRPATNLPISTPTYHQLGEFALLRTKMAHPIQ
jgi:hypothetical protein